MWWWFQLWALQGAGARSLRSVPGQHGRRQDAGRDKFVWKRGGLQEAINALRPEAALQHAGNWDYKLPRRCRGRGLGPKPEGIAAREADSKRNTKSKVKWEDKSDPARKMKRKRQLGPAVQNNNAPEGESNPYMSPCPWIWSPVPTPAGITEAHWHEEGVLGTLLAVLVTALQTLNCDAYAWSPAFCCRVRACCSGGPRRQGLVSFVQCCWTYKFYKRRPSPDKAQPATGRE